MKLKNTLILFVVAIAIFGVCVFLSKGPSTKEAAERSKHIVNVDRDDIDGITITNGEDKLELRKQGSGQWNMLSPVKDRADSIKMSQLLTGLEGLNVESSFNANEKSGGKEPLKEYGLEQSSLSVKLLLTAKAAAQQGKNASPEILIGNDAAVAGKMYARLADSDKVYVINSDLKAVLQKKPDDFRDHKLLELDTNRVEKFVVKSGAGEIDMAKENKDWVLEKPLKARGDNQKISDLIAQTVNAQIDAFESDANPGGYGLSEPEGTISLTLEGAKEPTVLEIGKPVEKDKEKIHARVSTRQAVLTLSKKIEDVLNIKPDDVRDKHLFRLNYDTVDRIHIQPAGKPEIVLARKQEDWTLKTSGDAEANLTNVKQMETELRDEQATAFVSDVASDLPKYGLDKPSLKIMFAAYASENTAETKAGESPILTLDFGRVNGDTVYARLESEPWVVSVPKRILDSMPEDPAVWRDLSVYKFKPEEITSMEVVREGQTTAVERAGANAWKLTKGNGTPDQGNIQSLQNAIAKLRAVRWTGSSTAGLGFEKPLLVVSFATTGKQTGKLTIGSPTAGDMWNARADGIAGAFLVSKPDYEILRADLTDTAQPSPVTPASGGSPAPAVTASPSPAI